MKKKFRIKNIKVNGSLFSNYLQYGVLCIKSLSPGILTANQLESVRRCILRKFKRKALIWIRTQCVYPVTQKPIGSRMGKGCGPIKKHIFNLTRGKIILEIEALISKEFLSFLKQLILRLPVKACILYRSYY